MNPLDVASESARRRRYFNSSSCIRWISRSVPPLKRVNALGHEIGEHDAVGNGRVFQRRAVGVGDRLHQQPDHVLAAGKESLEQLADRSSPGRRKNSSPRGVEKRRSRLRPALANRSISSRVKSARSKRGGQREHRVVEADVLELHDRIGDLAGPIPPAALDHADRKAVQRDIEDVPAGPAEPGGHAAELVMLLEQAARCGRRGPACWRPSGRPARCR